MLCCEKCTVQLSLQLVVINLERDDFIRKTTLPQKMELFLTTTTPWLLAITAGTCSWKEDKLITAKGKVYYCSFYSFPHV